MSTIVRPSTQVAAQRRRAFLYLPLMVAGALVSVAGGPMITVFNSLDVLGAAMMLAGLFGFVRKVAK